MTIETRIAIEPIAEPKVKTTADVLRHAAWIIEERGWWQGTWTPDYDVSGPVCVWGAIQIAEGYDLESGIGPIGPAYHALSRCLDNFLIPQWNDEPGRTAAEVTTALRAAADAAESAS